MKGSKTALGALGTILNMLLLVLIAFVVLRLGTSAYDLGYRMFTEPPVEAGPGRDVSVTVKKGMSAWELGTLLEEKGLVDSGMLFAAQVKAAAYSEKIKPGTYTLNTSLEARKMMQIMAKEEIEETEE